MRRRTAAAVLSLTVLLAGLAVVGLGDGLVLSERWVSDTPRDNEINHHPLAVGPDGETIVTPVAAVPGEGPAPTADSCALVSLAPSNGSVRWRNGVPAGRCMAHALTEPAIGDLDGDGSMEVTASTTEETLVVLDAATGREEFRVSQPVYGYGPPTIGDVLPASGKEIVASDIGGNLVVVRANGSVAWRHSLNETFDSVGSVWDRPIVADVDGDGGTEIAVGSTDGPVVLAANGSVEWAGRTGATYLVDAQADGDAARELFAVDGTEIRAVDGASHERTWRRDLGTVARLQAARDADGDGDVELYVGLANGTAVALDAGTGETEWTTTVTTADDGVLAAPVVASVGSDRTAIVAAARDGTVALLDPATGAERAAYARNVPVWTYPTPADIDGDGTDEILVRYGDGRVVALAISS